ncbi:hypothetical protein C4K18_2871 [Pseudomonas chlororaphis subsp. aurantiaca]|nr:hypothetical protein C4K18_2871 [Pseudomonas chlororaphis subsp. aurantiaca]
MKCFGRNVTIAFTKSLSKIILCFWVARLSS